MAKKQALGRGLGALLPEIDVQEELSNQEKVRQIEIANLHPNPDQPRKDFNEERLAELAESIKTFGVMQPLLVTLDPSQAPADLVTHSGQEFNMVLEGSVKLTFDNQEIILNAGDTVYFNPQYPHGQSCAGNEPATFLTVIAE